MTDELNSYSEIYQENCGTGLNGAQNSSHQFGIERLLQRLSRQLYPQILNHPLSAFEVAHLRKPHTKLGR